jgi:5'-nucleotidase
MGPIVLYQDLMEVFPYNDENYSIHVTGAQLRTMVKHILRDDAFIGETEFYQFSRGLRIEYDSQSKELISLSLKGKEVKDDDMLSLALQKFHLNSIKEFLNVTLEEVTLNKKPKLLTSSETDLLEEYLSTHDLIRAPEERRLIIR